MIDATTKINEAIVFFPVRGKENNWYVESWTLAKTGPISRLSLTLSDIVYIEYNVYIVVSFIPLSMSAISSGTSENNDNFDHKEPGPSESQTGSKLYAELGRTLERLSQQIDASSNRILGLEQQLSTLNKDIKGLHDLGLRDKKGSINQLHSEIRNLQIHVKKIDKSINDAFGKVKPKKKDKKGKQKGKVKKK